jgi:membrane-associated phospholipid phosphatase
MFTAVNALPDGAYGSVWLPMQYGSLWVVPTLAGLALTRKRPGLAVAMGVSGAAAWVAAKVVKPAVGRGRPAGLVGAARLRGKEEGDLGFPSGHAAVSATLTVAAWPRLSTRERRLAAALCGFVPLARLYVGAHLPLDVVGGSALGLTIGSAVHTLLGRRGR